MDAYSMIRGGKLSLKKKANSSKSASGKRKAVVSAPVVSAEELDERRHGGWWPIERKVEITGTVSLEFEDMRYLKSLDNGFFEVGESHSPGESPDEQEMILAMKVSGTNKFSFKTGFGKFAGVTAKSGTLVATADAIGQLEMWDVILEDGKVYLQAGNNEYVSVLPDSSLGCVKDKESVCGNLKIRSCAQRKIDPRAHLPKEERGGVQQTEINYVKSFSGLSAEKRLKLSSDEKTNLQKSRREGSFHEALLDRREKIKSDKHCK